MIKEELRALILDFGEAPGWPRRRRVRPITAEVSTPAAYHGSALFTRGQTRSTRHNHPGIAWRGSEAEG